MINIAADISVMREAAHLVGGESVQLYSIGIGFPCLTLKVFLPYRSYVKYLQWVTLGLFTYVVVMFVIQVK